MSRHATILLTGDPEGDNQTITVSESVIIIETVLTRSSRNGLANQTTRLDAVFSIDILNRLIDKREELERIHNWPGWRREDRQDNPGDVVS